MILYFNKNNLTDIRPLQYIKHFKIMLRSTWSFYITFWEPNYNVWSKDAVSQNLTSFIVFLLNILEYSWRGESHNKKILIICFNKNNRYSTSTAYSDTMKKTVCCRNERKKWEDPPNLSTPQILCTIDPQIRLPIKFRVQLTPKSVYLSNSVYNWVLYYFFLLLSLVICFKVAHSNGRLSHLVLIIFCN